MTVTYSPPLMEQIRENRAARIALANTPIVVFIQSCNEFVKRVDPKTRQATAERQQFARDGGRLTILPRWQWVAEPITIEGGTWRC